MLIHPTRLHRVLPHRPRAREGSLGTVGLALLAAVACAHGATELGTDGPPLASLRFEGNRRFDAAALAEGLATDAHRPWPWSAPPHFDAAAFQGDLDRVATFYRARGYFDARIIDTQITPRADHAVEVVVRLDEGLPYTTRTFAIVGADALPTELQAQVAGPHECQVGKTFTQDDYEKTKRAVLATLQEAAFASAAVEGRAVVVRGAHAVDVRLQVSAGVAFRYGALDIVGNHRIPDDRIEQEIGGILKTGDAFHASGLEEVRARLTDLGVFGNVDVRPGTPDPVAGTIPVVINVAEAPLNAFRAGGGIGLDAEHQEAHVSAGYTNRDFLGQLRRLDFDNTVALEWLPNVVSPEFGAAQPALLSALKLKQPGFFGRGFDLVTSLQGQREVEIGYADWGLRGRIAVPMRPVKHLFLTAAYNADFTFFDSGSTFNGLSLSPAALLQLGDANHAGPYVLSYLEESAAVDFRDDPIEPHRGVYAKATLQEAGGPLFGTFSDVRVRLEARGYLSWGANDVVALRGELGELVPYNGSATPIEQRFFLGGLDSVRGYGSLRLSPMVRVNTCGPQVNGHTLCRSPTNSIGVVDVPVGGDGMGEASLELRHRFSESLGGVAFADVGEVLYNIAAANHQMADGFHFRQGAGGLFVTPVLQ